jgi:hypothetical protein
MEDGRNPLSAAYVMGWCLRAFDVNVEDDGFSGGVVAPGSLTAFD